MKNYKEKKQIKRFVKTSKPISKGDQKMKEYHDKPADEKMQDANPLMVPEGEIACWATSKTIEFSSWNEPSWPQIPFVPEKPTS